MINVNTASAAELSERAVLLVGEIDANEQEKQILQSELNDIYAEIDARRDAAQATNCGDGGVIAGTNRTTSGAIGQP